ncbi:MAG: hypothetical protein M3Q00_09700 [Pseudomonadota bacterium]|nr:hypothetical protein [Pseudomonadota bacterium]
MGMVPLGFATLYPGLPECLEKRVDTGWPWAIASPVMSCHKASWICVVAGRHSDYAASCSKADRMRPDQWETESLVLYENRSERLKVEARSAPKPD